MNNFKITNVEIEFQILRVSFINTQTNMLGAISVHLKNYPRLEHATEPQLKNWKISLNGQGIHWPDLDEDLSLTGILNLIPAPFKSGKQIFKQYGIIKEESDTTRQ